MRRETPTRECKCGSTMTTHGGRKECLDCRSKQRESPERKARAIIHQLVNRAIAAGKLVRQPCEVCGAVKVDAHHDDYSKPIEVRWLCRTHHKQHHKQHHNTVNRGANHMTASANEVLAVAAVVWDQDSHNSADLAFLAAIAKADSEWIENLNHAKILFGPGEAFVAVKCLATRQRNAACIAALAELEAKDDESFGLLQAAE